MRQIQLTANEFDNFVYPFISGASAQNDGEWETALRLLKKLKDPEQTVDQALNKEELAAQAAGKAVYPFRVCKVREWGIALVLEEDELALLLARVKARRPHVSFAAAEDFNALVEKLENAEEFAVDVPEREPEPVAK